MNRIDDLISRQAAIDAFLAELTKRERKNLLHTWSTVEVKYFVVDMLEKLPPAQPDAVTASLEELINDYGEDGFFIVDGVNYQANELFNELKTNSSVGEKFRKQITKTIIQYFMKFGG